MANPLSNHGVNLPDDEQVQPELVPALHGFAPAVVDIPNNNNGWIEERPEEDPEIEEEDEEEEEEEEEEEGRWTLRIRRMTMRLFTLMRLRRVNFQLHLLIQTLPLTLSQKLRPKTKMEMR
nr:hypothetical protein [Tanacetum cinerariifolium]